VTDITGTKSTIHIALKAAKSKPAMITATSIDARNIIPVVGTAASPCMFISCGILIPKTLS
jgi:hypothetical protein